jgi:PAS domain S-box-containing protein
MKRVLIVDDDKSIRRMLVRNLRSEYTVIEAASGRQALAILDDTPVDLILLDQLMPGESGLETLMKIRQSLPYVPVIMVTAHGLTHLVVEFMRAGGTDFVQKPIVDMDVLRLKIRQALSSAEEFQQEITRRRKAEEALREREEQYRTLFEQASDGVFVANTQGQCIEANTRACTMLGYTCDELLNKPIEALVAKGDLKEVPLDLHTLPSGQGMVRELHFARKDGTLLPVEISAKILSDGRWQIFVRDITGRRQAEDERRKLEEQLRQSQKMEALGTLAGGIAHDFNNILTAILGYTEIALRHTPREGAPWKNMQEVFTAGIRARDLVKQILIFSRQTVPERRPLLLHLLIHGTLRLLRPSLPSTVTIRTQINTTSGLIMADATQIQQILLNLGSNAEYAMRDSGGTLEVGLDEVTITPEFAAEHSELRPGPYMCLTVRDTGEGMAPEVVARAFEPFFTTKGVGEGTGMGLAVAHGIVTSHGGAILVDSQPGQGTTFTIYLPRIEESPVEEAEIDEPVRKSSARILFVDDEEAIATLAQDMLVHMGHEVMAYTSSQEALDAFRATPDAFDLVITDQTMPQMTGSALARAVRGIRPDMPIILCTGFSHTIDAEKANAAGIDAFYVKPLVARSLTRTIQQVLEQDGSGGSHDGESAQGQTS